MYSIKKPNNTNRFVLISFRINLLQHHTHVCDVNTRNDIFNFFNRRCRKPTNYPNTTINHRFKKNLFFFRYESNLSSLSRPYRFDYFRFDYRTGGQTHRYLYLLIQPGRRIFPTKICRCATGCLQALIKRFESRRPRRIDVNVYVRLRYRD